MPVIAFVFALLLFCVCGESRAQTPVTDGSTPPAIAPGTPAGSYVLSEFDNVSLYGGGLNFSLPLVRVGGRGIAGADVRLTIDPKWLVDYYEDNGGYPASYATIDWWTERPGYGPGLLMGRYGGEDYQYCSTIDRFQYFKTVSRLTFITPNGTEVELRDRKTAGQPVS